MRRDVAYFALSVRMIVYFDLQVWIARLEEGKKPWHFLQQSSCLCWKLCSRWAINPNVELCADAQWKRLFARQKKRNQSWSFMRCECSFFYCNFCMTWIKNGDEATHGSCVWEEKEQKQAEILHRAANIPEPAREEIFYKGLDSSFFLPCSQSDFKPSGSPAVHFWVLQARNCSAWKHWAETGFFNPFSGF